MKIYRKESDVLHILSSRDESAEIGDYLLVKDTDSGKEMIVQVIDTQFANVPGLLEELLRSLPDGSEIVRGNDFDPLEIAPHVTYIQDSNMLRCKIRASLGKRGLSPSGSWLPSRSRSTIEKLPISSLVKIAEMNGKLPIIVGSIKDNTVLTIDASSLDGKLNIIAGKKETGKSHLSKLLMLCLLQYGATAVVFDLNGEYVSLGLTSDGKRTASHNRIHVLTPSQNFKVALGNLHLNVLLNILVHALRLPGTSTREFRRIWRSLKEKGILTLRDLGDSIRCWNCNHHVRDALSSRYHALVNSGFFTDNVAEGVLFEEILLRTRQGGGIIVVKLRDTSSADRQIVVEYVLGKLVELLTSWRLKAVFLFAEEAHIYLRETYWDDIVTRMRHFGIFTTFITNQPDTIRENIYRQADNIFLLNFTNEHDLEAVSRASSVDAETVKSIARELPPRHCLLLGRAVRDFPIVVRVRSLDIKTMGETRLFFTDTN